MAKLAKYLERLGWSITIVCRDEPSPAMTDLDLLGEIPASVRVVRVASGSRASVGVAGSAKRRLDRQSRAFRGLHAGREAVRAMFGIPDRWVAWALAVRGLSPRALGGTDVIVSSGPPHSTHLAGAWLSKRLSVPLVLDFRDEWAGNPVYASRVPWRAPLARALEGWCLRRATAIVVISEESEAHFRAKDPRLASRITVIPNGFDPEDFEGSAASLPSQRDHVEFLHAGSLYGRNDRGQFFAAFGAFARSLGGDRPPVLTLLGPVNDAQRTLLGNSIAREHFRLEAPVSHAEAVDRMRSADVLVLLTNAVEAGPGTLTGKVFEYLAARRPILALAPEGEVSRLIHEAGAGISVDPTAPTDVAGAIRGAMELASAGVTFAGAPDEVLARFDRRQQTATWSALLDDVATPAKRSRS